MYVTTTSPCSRRLRLSKFSGSIGPPGVMRAQFRLIIKYAGLPGRAGSPESSMLSNRNKKIGAPRVILKIYNNEILWFVPGLLSIC